MKYILCCAWLMMYALLHGQATLSVDRTEIRIGDQVKATVELLSSMGGDWVNKKSIWPDSLTGIEVISGPDSNAANTGGLVATYTLSFFDTGYVRIPPLPVVLRHNGRLDTFYTRDVPIKVDPVEPDSSGLIPIKDIYEEPFNLLYYKRFIPHLIGALLLLIALFIWWKKRKKPEPEVVFVMPPISPHEWAYEQLRELEKKRLWQSGEVKEHYSMLTGILRGYLERRFDIHALEQTSDVIIGQLKKLKLSESTLRDSESLLSMADLVKFAKADPGIDVHADAIKRVEKFVRETAAPTVTTELTDTKPDAEPVG
jgi:hypothetical protein